MAHATRTPRPHRIVTFSDGVTVVQEYGRRAGLHTSKSAIRDRQRTFNRQDRHQARAQLRRDPEAVELRQPRGRALWSAV